MSEIYRFQNARSIDKNSHSMFNTKAGFKWLCNILYIVSAVNMEHQWNGSGWGKLKYRVREEDRWWEMSRCLFFHHKSHKVATGHQFCAVFWKHNTLKSQLSGEYFRYHSSTASRHTMPHSSRQIMPFTHPCLLDLTRLPLAMPSNLSEFWTSFLGQSQVYQQYCRHFNCTHCRSYHRNHACLLSEHNAYEWRERWRTADPRRIAQTQCTYQYHLHALKPISTQFIGWQLLQREQEFISDGSGYYMYHQFHIHKLYFPPTQCIYVFCVDLRINSDYFPIQIWLVL